MPENPVSDAEKRKKLRRDCLRGYEAWGADPDQSVMLAALDGLDIADFMAEMLPAHAERGCAGCKIALARWQDWQGVGGTKEKP